MNITSNPWSFVPGDVQTQTITSTTLNADGTVTLVGAGNLTAGMVQDAFVTVIGVTNALYNGFYKIETLSSATTAILIPFVNSNTAQIGRIPVGTTASSGGTVGLPQWTMSKARIEDISWQSTGAPLATSVIASGDVLVITDLEGKLLWSAVGPTTTGSYSQNRGKLFWVSGVTIFAMTHGVVLMTIN